MAEYPTLEARALGPFRVIQAELAANPQYLDAPECPYPDAVIEFLRVFGGGNGAPKASSEVVSDTLNGNLEAEATELLRQLKEFSTSIRDGDVAERMSYFRTATSLIEKIIGINERATGLRQITEFQTIVLQIFDSELSGDQRTRIMQRLRQATDEKAPE